MPKIFISHTWEDKAFVWQLEAELKATGLEVWVDHSGVRGGDNLPKRISDALAWCDMVLLIWSEAAGLSHWVELEWTNALSLRKTIIPCLVSQAQLPALLANVLYVDCRDFGRGFMQLRQALHLESPPKTSEPLSTLTTKERRIDAAVPNAAEVGPPIDLRVQVRFPDSPQLGLEDWPAKNKPSQLEQGAENVALEFPVDAVNGKLGAARLEIHVVAPDFDIAGNTRQILLVPPDAPSKCLSFLITPRQTGVCRLNVEVYNVEHIFLGAIPIETEVGGVDKSQSTNVANLFLFVMVGQEKRATRFGEQETFSKPNEVTTPPSHAPSQTATSRDRQIIQAKETSNQRGGVNISGSTVHINGDVVGRDKITHHHHYGEKKERPIPRMARRYAPRVFIGRDKVLRELIAALKLGEEGAGPIALTALKGMGGIGKTTLAAALANHPKVENAMPEGTLWAGLGPEPEVMSLLAEWGKQLGEDFAQFDSPETCSRRLSTLLHDKKALLIVDDVWQADAARHFLVGGPRCRALITTRNNEIARKLAGHDAVRVEILTNTASLNLLRELAPQAVSADEKAANRLATVLDGLPLALTLAGQMLAAEWEAGLGVAGALSELEDREARLKLAGAEKRPGLATAEPSLRAILAMSYERLSNEATKRAFRLLGVFGGKPLTFSIEAAAAVWEMELRPAQKTMLTLVGRALVEPVEGGRYTLHTTLADFAESLLEEHSEAALARETHANYYLQFGGRTWRRIGKQLKWKWGRYGEGLIGYHQDQKKERWCWTMRKRCAPFSVYVDIGTTKSIGHKSD